MKSKQDLNNLKLKDLIQGLCINPTPFKLIETFDEEVSVLEALKAFENSNKKRKVIGVKTKTNLVYHIGEHEMQNILKSLHHQS